jgi:hypothetical protein
MPSDNRLATYSTGDVIVASDLNDLQERTVDMRELNQEEATLPSDFLGAHCIYGEWGVSNGETDVLDYSWNYWTHAPMDWRNRQCLIYAVQVGASDELPSSATHDPSDVTATGWDSFNTKSGQATPLGAGTYQPFGTNFYIYPDTTNGTLYCTNSTGAAVYFYAWIMFSKPTTANAIGEHRVKSMAAYARVTSDFLNEFQDRSQMYVAANQDESGLSRNDAGWHYGEFTIANGANKQLDSGDWRNDLLLVKYRDVAQGNSRLPSQANHAPNVLQNQAYLFWNTRTGVAIGGPFGVGTNAWAPIANVNIYADIATGDLYCSNNIVGPADPIEIYLQILRITV